MRMVVLSHNNYNETWIIMQHFFLIAIIILLLSFTDGIAAANYIQRKKEFCNSSCL